MNDKKDSYFMFKYLKYDLVIKKREEIDIYDRKNGVYCLRIKDSNIYVGRSVDVFKRASRFFSKNCFESDWSINTRLEFFLRSIWIEPYPDLEIYIKFVDDKSELDDLETTWIVGLKPMHNYYKTSHMNVLLEQRRDELKLIKFKKENAKFLEANAKSV